MGKGQGYMGRALAIAAIVTCAVVAPLAGIAAAGEGQGGSGSTEVLATLQVDAQTVQVKKSGADAFKDAKDGQKLREGDTVKTDATGKAEIDYGGDTYTRLDVNTTFTIVSLTDDQGNRQIKGSLESGQTWNRTVALTESESYEQEGGGATAAVAGTAFAVECESENECVVTAVDHQTRLTGNGEVHVLDPLDQCDAQSGDLCDDVHALTIDEIAAIEWIQQNLLRDLLERGLGNGPFVVSLQGTLIVEDGAVVEFVQTQAPVPPPPPPPDDVTPPEEPPPPPPPVTVDGVNIESVGGDPAPGVVTGPAASVVSEDERSDVTFTIRVTNPDGGTYYLVFTQLPDATFGVLYVGAAAPGNEVITGVQYASDTVFVFDPVEIEPVCTPAADEFSECYTTGNPETGPNGPYPSQPVDNGDGTVSWTGSFTVKAVDADTGQESVETPIELESVDDICGENPARAACDVLSTPTTVGT